MRITRVVKNSILRWLGVPITLDNGDFWKQYLTSGDNSAGQRVDEKSILGLSAAYACSRLISEAVGSLPLKIYRRTSAGREIASDHPLAFVLSRSPNAQSTPAQFWSAMTASMLLWGNGFAEILRVGSRVAGLQFLHPSKVKGFFNNKGALTGYEYQSGSNEVKKLALTDVLHIPAFGTDGQWGISAIAYGAPVFGNSIAGITQANATFKNGLAPTVALKMEQWVKPEQRKEMRARMSEISGAINSGQLAVVEGGMDVEVIGINPKDAQLLESRAFSVEEICRWFGTDPSMIGHGTAVSNWGTGLEQKMIAFLTLTLRPLLVRLEQGINKYLIQDDAFYCEYAVEGFLRADSAGRAAFYREMITQGVYTRDEVRQLENLPSMGGNSAKQTIQSGFTTLESIGMNNEPNQ